MSKLAFDYDSRTGESVATYGDKYRVRMVHDSCPLNPFEDWEGHWPMVTRYDRNQREYNETKAHGALDVFAHFSDGQITRHQRAIESIIAKHCTYRFDSGLAEYKRDYGSSADSLRDYFGELIGDSLSDSDKFDCLAELYTLIKIPALSTCSTGYSQGDYSELLIVATPAAQAKFGIKSAKRDFQRDMKGQAELYGAWAWGDVYGFIAERLTGDDRDDSDSWEEVDSCWGFYGSDADKSGLAEAALGAIKCDAREREIERTSRLKELIRNRVPVHVRQQIMAAF